MHLTQRNKSRHGALSTSYLYWDTSFDFPQQGRKVCFRLVRGNALHVLP